MNAHNARRVDKWGTKGKGQLGFVWGMLLRNISRGQPSYGYGMTSNRTIVAFLKKAGGFVLLVLFTLKAMTLQAADKVEFQSGVNRTAVVELYTSEGCSSCPPAEAWLSKLKSAPGLWRDFVPVAFHVDYWDDLGWRDVWAKREFTARQRTYASVWGSDTIYTPGMVLNGKEWRNWRGEDSVQTDKRESSGVLTVRSMDGKKWLVEFEPEKRLKGHMVVTVVLLGSEFKSDVKAGENSGRTLKHDFVALKWEQTALSQKEGKLVAEVELPVEMASQKDRLAIAAWVSVSGRPEPVQATGGWLRQ